MSPRYPSVHVPFRRRLARGGLPLLLLLLSAWLVPLAPAQELPQRWIDRLAEIDLDEAITIVDDESYVQSFRNAAVITPPADPPDELAVAAREVMLHVSLLLAGEEPSLARTEALLAEFNVKISQPTIEQYRNDWLTQRRLVASMNWIALDPDELSVTVFEPDDPEFARLYPPMHQDASPHGLRAAVLSLSAITIRGEREHSAFVVYENQTGDRWHPISHFTRSGIAYMPGDGQIAAAAVREAMIQEHLRDTGAVALNSAASGFLAEARSQESRWFSLVLLLAAAAIIMAAALVGLRIGRSQQS